MHEYAVEDPKYYSQVWHGEASWLDAGTEVYEFACHEGNYALGGILGGARRQERDSEPAQ